MSEHKTNDKALFSASLPRLAPVGWKHAISIDLHVLPQPHIMLLKSSQWRTNDGGEIEICTEGTGDKWELAGIHASGKKVEVYELGKELPPDKCDVIFMVSTVVEARPALLTARKSYRLSNVPHFPLCRIPLDVWRAEHEQNLDTHEQALSS